MIPARTFVNASNPVLFRHWVRYYKALGCDKFLLVINYSADEDAEKITEIIRDENIDAITWEWKGRFLPPEKYHFIDQQMALLRDMSCTYIVNTDMDEFVEFPTKLPDLLMELVKSENERVVGFFVDRISDELKPLDPLKSIFEQAPFNAHVTHSLVKGYTLKIPVTRCSIRPNKGWHIKNWYKTNYPHMVPVYHFKWFTGLTEYMKNRYKHYRSQNLHQFRESKRVHDFLSKGRSLMKYAIPNGERITYREHEYKVDWVSRREQIKYLQDGMYP